MVTREELGVGYLLGVGAGLIVSSVGHLLFVDVAVITYWIGVLVAAGLGAGLLFVGAWLWRSSLRETHAWQVATWCALGLSVPTFVGVLITVVKVRPAVVPLFQSLFIVSIATGGIIGVLVGTVLQLVREHSRTQKLTQRTSVFNRVLRHDIRNQMNIILGQADLLKKGDEPAEEVADQIQYTGQRIIEMSRAIRRVEEHEADSPEAVDVVATVEDSVSRARKTFPDADITTDLPETAWVRATPLFPIVVDNLIENAIRHNDSEPDIRVSVSCPETGPGTVELRVTDNGPGIPDHELEVLERDAETALDHGSGLGLWLVKWFCESDGVDLEFGENDPRGSVVTIRLPPTSPGVVS